MNNQTLNYLNGQITIYATDCMNAFCNIPDESVSLIITSPPYCMGKEYENISDDMNSFVETNTKVLKESIIVLKKGGRLCWQVGFHVNNAISIPLDIIVYNIVNNINSGLNNKNKMFLRNRIVWTFGHGVNSEKRFSGRYETILWFTKGDKYIFNLDSVRVPQKYPGKKYSHGKKAGQFSGNPLGKNPSDVWDIPNVKANHIEKTSHPCQFPVAIPQRLIKALTNEGDLIMDPFLGSGTTAVAAILENRRFVGSEIKIEYIDICKERIEKTINGCALVRPDIPVMKPDKRQKVAQKPKEFKW